MLRVEDRERAGAGAEADAGACWGTTQGAQVQASAFA